MAITLRDHFPAIGQQEVEILAVDVNPAIIEKAVPAVYSAWSLRETPALVRQRHFRADGNDFVLDESVRAMVTFEERNLVEEDATFWRTDRFDVIFCRNVIMYLVPGLIQRVVERLVQSLVPGGFLFLGHAETLRGLSQEVHLRRTHGTFYYQKRKPSEAQPAALEAPQGAAWPLPRVFHSYESWVDVIQSASERIGNLVRDCRQPGAETVQPPADGRPRYAQAELGAALELLRQERFREALDVLPAAADVDTQLLRAVLLANCGDIPAVEAVCDQIRRSDDLNASAHYLTALCREHAGDLRGASEHDRVAVYLDPEFAMPHLHLGLLAKRMGDVHAARNELQQAENLLLREDASRILLLGGGFSREALLKFSRAALDACGAAS